MNNCNNSGCLIVLETLEVLELMFLKKCFGTLGNILNIQIENCSVKTYKNKKIKFSFYLEN